MKKSSIDQGIRSRIDAFVTEISGLLRGSALEAVQSALGGEGSARPARTTGRGRGRPPGKAKAKTGKRERRDSSEVEALAERFHAYVNSNPGQRLEEIGKGLGIDTKALKLPVLKLVAAKAVKTTGQKRGTKYHAGAGKAKAGGKKGGGKKAKGKQRATRRKRK